MPWQDWVDLSFIAGVFRHVFCTVASILLFAVPAWLVKLVGSAEPIRDAIDRIDDVVLIGLLGILAVQLLADVIKQLWKQLRTGWNGTQLLAV